MSAGYLIEKLEAQGCRLWVESGELKISAPAGAVTPELLEQVRQHKTAILDRLQASMPSFDEVLQQAKLVKAEFIHDMRKFDCERFAKWLLQQRDPDWCCPAGIRAWQLLIAKEGYPQ